MVFLAAALLSTFITARDGGKLQVLDWGGHGETVVLLAGLGNTGYIYSDFAPRLTDRFRVLAVTRRGSGRSAPATEFSPQAQARDVRDVLDALGIERAILIGHSLAGGELTAFATEFPERTAALIYLDAAYDRSLQVKFDDDDPVPWRAPAAEDLASMTRWLQYMRRRGAFPGANYGKLWCAAVEADVREQVEILPDGRVRERSQRRSGAFFAASASSPPDYRRITAPILAIYAEPRHYPYIPTHADAELKRKAEAFYRDAIRPWTKESIVQLRRQAPAATIVEIRSMHHVFIQHPRRIERLIRKFLAMREPRPTPLISGPRPAAPSPSSTP